MHFRYKGRKYRLHLFPIILILLILTALIIWAAGRLLRVAPPPTAEQSSLPRTDSSAASTSAVGGEPSEPPSETSSKDSDVIRVKDGTGQEQEYRLSKIPKGCPSDWNLILLNPSPENKIDKELEMEKTQFDTQWVDSRAAAAYEEMRTAAAVKVPADGFNGVTLYLRSGYRSIATQKVNFEANIKRELNRGNTQEEALRLTKLYYTEPGHSEHHSGLAFDIITPEYHNDIYSLDERFAQTEAYKWLSIHSVDYGFILRYPKDKQEITKINFEPWHYRFVGTEHAQFMREHNLCLEEYVDLLHAAGR